jgi:hypothetical protein
VVEATGVIAIDTNLLIYGRRSACQEHRAAQRAIEEAGRHPNSLRLIPPDGSVKIQAVAQRSLTGIQA